MTHSEHFVLPSDNMKPETAHSHSGWPCTSSYRPLDLHQSEEKKKKTFSCNSDGIMTSELCHFIIWSTVTVPGRHRRITEPINNSSGHPNPDLTLARDKLPAKNIWQPEEFTDSVFNRTVGFVKSSEPVWSYQTGLVFTARHLDGSCGHIADSSQEKTFHNIMTRIMKWY